MTNDIHLDSFGTGIITGLAAEGINAISVRNLDVRMVHAFRWLEANVDAIGLRLRFHISLDEIHGDAPTARAAINGAAARGLVMPDDDHSLRILVFKDDAPLYLEHLPGGADLWRGVARALVGGLDNTL